MQVGDLMEVRGDVDQRALDQLKTCALAGDAVGAAMMADGHVGYSQPIGGVVAYPNHISPSGVGYDIACGNKAVRTNIDADDLRPDLHKVMDEVFKTVAFGVGQKYEKPHDHIVIDHIAHALFAGQRGMWDMARQQLGSVGGGNHYVDLFSDEENRVWIGVHFGSRGFGWRTASGFMSMAQGMGFQDRTKEHGMDAPPILLEASSDMGQAYIMAMKLAGEYAYAGRDIVCELVMDILGAESMREVHNHHNFAWRETVAGTEAWVIRKGATPAKPGQLGFVGATMGEDSVILQGQDGDAAEALMYSTVHGAGRAMSRTQAAGKMGTTMECNERGCDFKVARTHYVAEYQRAIGLGTIQEGDRFTLCLQHREGKMLKRRGRVRDGLINWDEVQEQIAAQGIVLRGGAADEAPAAYKRLDEVLSAHADTISIVHRLTPMGVAMAASDDFDPYKD